jgi:hypothetical protein
VLPEHVVDVPVLPPRVSADDVVPADVGPGELTELGLPLLLQPRQPDAATGRILWQLPLVHRENLPAAADEVVELGTLRYRRDDIACCRHVPPLGQVPRRQDNDHVLPENTRLGLGEVRWADEAAADGFRSIVFIPLKKSHSGNVQQNVDEVVILAVSFS